MNWFVFWFETWPFSNSGSLRLDDKFSSRLRMRILTSNLSAEPGGGPEKHDRERGSHSQHRGAT
jgi:hypothetical protein